MKVFRADLHIHTVLSPCGDLEMSPRNIVEEAARKKLDLIGITDHNSTRQAEVVRQLAHQRGIAVLTGAEVTTREEVHCLAFLPDEERRLLFQHFLDEQLPVILNSEGRFGYQALVDASDNILELEERLLITGLRAGIGEVEQEVHRLGGLFIPAHIDRSVNSIFSQLGFIPPGLHFEALEITRFVSEESARQRFGIAEAVTLTASSDAHYPQDIGAACSLFYMHDLSFAEIRLALLGRDGRKVMPQPKENR